MNSNDGPVAPLNRKRLAEFLAVMTQLVEDAAGNESAILKGAETALRNLIAHDDWLDEAFARPDPDNYRQYLLYCDPLRRFSVVSFVWGPGQETPIHDHTMWGLVGVLRGAELCDSYFIDGSLPVLCASDRVGAGDVVAVSPIVGDIHKVSNAAASTSISIHVYGGDIGAVRRHVFRTDGSLKEFVSGYSNIVLPNVWGQQ